MAREQAGIAEAAGEVGVVAVAPFRRRQGEAAARRLAGPVLRFIWKE